MAVLCLRLRQPQQESPTNHRSCPCAAAKDPPGDTPGGSKRPTAVEWLARSRFSGSARAEVEAIKVHHFRPSGNEVGDEFLL